MKYWCGILFGLYISTFQVISQQHTGEWKVYTAKNAVNVVSCRNDVVWSGTSGGIFSYRFSDSSFTQFTSSEGLPSNEITGILTDNDGSVWVGTQSGGLAHYTPSSGRWQINLDITQSTVSIAAQKQINGFLSSGDSLYIFGEFGVALFHKRAFEFGDTYNHFISPSSNCALIAQGKIWIGTDKGVEVAWLSSSNLVSPDSWQSYGIVENNNAAPIVSIFENHAILFAATSNGIYSFQNDAWNLYWSSSSFKILKIIPVQDGMIVLSSNGIYKLTQSMQLMTLYVNSGLTFSDFTLTNAGDPVIATTNNGLIYWKNKIACPVIPNGPASNLFLNLAVDNNGVVWVGTGRDGHGTGFMSFDGTSWMNYDKSKYPFFKDNDFYHASIGTNNSKWISAWGGGVVSIDNKGNVILFNHAKAGFAGDGDNDFVVIGDVATDWRGNTWMIDLLPDDGKILWVMRPDSTWSGFTAPSQIVPSTYLDGLTIDQNGNKWIFIRDDGVKSYGLFFVDSKGTLDDVGDDEWYIITSESNSLESDNIKAVAVDNQGSLWVGTDQGANYIVDPSNPFAANNIFTVYPLHGLYINSIIVDALNNIWVGTNQGIVVLSDQYNVLAQYTVASTNGKLPDDNVKSIAFDREHGIAYFGTDKGLAALKTDILAPKESFGTLTFAPNPYIIPSDHRMTINGLIADAGVKIYSIDGRMIRELNDKSSLTGGRIAYWDGKDRFGKDVSSGIYLIVAYSVQGDQVAKGKVAVIRK